jgi:hypothetical protein
MSSIWTPGGERPVPRPENSDPQTEPELTAEEQAHLEEAAQEVAAVRAQLAATPPDQVIANHVIGLYELAAIHLSQQPPGLPAARLAIDALGAVLDACSGRLGELEPTLAAARSQIQMAFVSVSRASTEEAGSTAPDASGQVPGASTDEAATDSGHEGDG